MGTMQIYLVSCLVGVGGGYLTKKFSKEGKLDKPHSEIAKNGRTKVRST